MDATAVCERVRRVATAQAAAVLAASDAGAGAPDRAALEDGLAAVTALRAWLAAAEAALARALAAAVSYPEQVLAEHGRSSLGEAGRVLERATTLAAVPSVGAALGDGRITPGHVDAVARVARGLQGAERDELLVRADRLAPVAAAVGADEFRRRLQREAQAIQADGGMGRFERQRRAARARRWTDADGMWCLSARFDPLTGVRLNARLDAELEALLAAAVPDDCPTDPLAKREFLAAQAVARLLEGQGSAAGVGRPEFVVVVDAGAPVGAADASAGGAGAHAGEAVADWGIPVEVPQRVLAALMGDARVTVVVVRNGVVLHAPGRLRLGRTTRLANRAQRRALRAMYATCGVPGCSVRFDRCHIHHVRWWEHGGLTDLENLLPLCVHHHTKVHEHGWVLALGPNRELTITFPDGVVHNTGPPGRRAA